MGDVTLQKNHRLGPHGLAFVPHPHFSLARDNDPGFTFFFMGVKAAASVRWSYSFFLWAESSHPFS
jgi:hypothetical protein